MLLLSVDFTTMLYLNKRTLNLFCGALCMLLLSISLYFQYIINASPCLLCMIQRVIITVLGSLFILAGLVNAQKKYVWCLYGIFITLVSGLGLSLAARHLWLQAHTPSSAANTCLPGLSYLLANFSFVDTLKKILSHSNECTKATWQLLGFNLSFWLLIFFIFFLLVGLVNMLKRR